VEAQAVDADRFLRVLQIAGLRVIVGAYFSPISRGMVLFMNPVRTALVVIVLTYLTAPLHATPSAAPQAATQEKTTPERVSADTPRATPGGASFTVPKEWSVLTGKNIVILSPPETDTHIVVFDFRSGEAAGAVKAAWAAYKPDSKRPVKLVTPLPPKEGWDERKVFDYETSPNERAAVQAIALRAGNWWTVAILDGTEPTVEKRGAAVGLVFESLRPKGYKRESFCGAQGSPVGFGTDREADCVSRKLDETVRNPRRRDSAYREQQGRLSRWIRSARTRQAGPRG
jgi:hypothetical protein